MTKQLYQFNFVIKGLIPPQVRLKRKIWLKKGELLLEKKGDDLHAYLLGNDTEGFGFNQKEKIAQYLWFACLVSDVITPQIEGGVGISISSKEELGTKTFYSVPVLGPILPEKDIEKIECYATKFIRFIKRLHDKYIDVVAENNFIKIALNFFYEAKKKFIYSSEGFINTLISIEALLNEGHSDIKYKISHRAAFLLGLYDIDPIEAFEKFKKIYDIRSKLVHGDESFIRSPDSNKNKNKGNKGKKIFLLLNEGLICSSNRYPISEYTKKLIIIFLILLQNEKRKKLSVKRRKEEILKEIDYAMLSSDKRNSLKKEIKKGFKDFKLNIPQTIEGEWNNRNYKIKIW